MTLAACTISCTDSNVRVSDKRSTFAIFINGARNEFRLIQFDGCVVKNDVACDWIVEKVNVARVAVELKGSDIEHAARQIEAALCFMKENGLVDLKMGGLIVCARYPSFDTTFQRIKQRIAKKFNVPIKVTRDARGLTIENLVSYRVQGSE